MLAAAGRGDGRGMGGRSSAMQSFVNVILASLLLYTPPFHSATPVAKLALSYVLRPMLPVVSYAIISGLVSTILRMVVAANLTILFFFVFVPRLYPSTLFQRRGREKRNSFEIKASLKCRKE